jgi:lipopolysaccharide biosynthesis glycosyltransferase
MNIALCTMIDDNFKIGFDVFWKSFIKNNSWFNHDLVIIDVGLSDASKTDIRQKYSKVVFKKPDKKNYCNVNLNKTHKKLQKTYYTLDVFSYTEYDRIVFIDSDVLILGDLECIFDCTDRIAGAKAYNTKLDQLGDRINSGVFVINKPVIGDRIYKKLLRIAQRGHSMPDQRTINCCFKDEMCFINKSFNVEKRMLHTKKYKHVLENAKVIHYVAKKPWEDGKDFNEIENSYSELEKMWWDCYNE